MSMAATRSQQTKPAKGRTLFERAQWAAERVRPQLDPDEDWEPTLLTWERIFMIGGVDEAVDMGVDANDHIAATILVAAGYPAVRELALIMTAWKVSYKPGSPEARFLAERAFDDMPRPKDDPRREEVVIVYGLRRGGPVRAAFAPIRRRDRQAPLLGRWQAGKAGGRIAEAMQAAVNGSA